VGRNVVPWRRDRVVLAIIFFARAKKLDMVALGDLVAVAAPIGLFFGRIANFVNGELWGKASTASWAMVFPSDPKQLPRHPSQLYEAALEGLVLFIILHVMIHRFKALRRPGLVIAVFWAGYGLFRFLIEEFFRENSHQSLGLISMGALLSLAMFAFAGCSSGIRSIARGPPCRCNDGRRSASEGFDPRRRAGHRCGIHAYCAHRAG
jgi:prolipoprotein diacylglyceryl transferase